VCCCYYCKQCRRLSVPKGDGAAWREVVELDLLQVVLVERLDVDHLALVGLDVFTDNTSKVGQTVDELRILLVVARIVQPHRLRLKDYLIHHACTQLGCVATVSCF